MSEPWKTRKGVASIVEPSAWDDARWGAQNLALRDAYRNDSLKKADEILAFVRAKAALSAPAPQGIGREVWIVTAIQGEWSDRSEWVVEVHETEDAGRNAVIRLDAEARAKAAADGETDYPYHALQPAPFLALLPTEPPAQGEG